jgi:hypothetical protein
VRHLLTSTIVLGFLGIGTALNAGEPITVSVYPAVATVRGTAQLKIVVERNDQNRTLTWEVDGEAFYRSSAAQLNGADAPRSWLFFVKDLPEGEYDVRATVKRNNNSESAALTRIIVVGGVHR